MSDDKARVWWQTQTKSWESLGCNENDDAFREFAHELLDEWLDWMGEQGRDHKPEMEAEVLPYNRLIFGPCDKPSHYCEEDTDE